MMYMNNVEFDDLFELRQTGDPAINIGGNTGQNSVGYFRAGVDITNRYAPASVGEADTSINRYWYSIAWFEPEINQTIEEQVSLGALFAAKGSRGANVPTWSPTSASQSSFAFANAGIQWQVSVYNLSNAVQSSGSVTGYRVATITGLNGVIISVNSSGTVSASGVDTANNFYSGTVTFEAQNSGGWSTTRFTLNLQITVEIQGGGGPIFIQ